MSNIETPQAEPRKWVLYAHQLQDGMFWHTSPIAEMVRLYGKENTVYKIEFAEDPEGTHFSWLKPNEEYPTMIYPTETHFSMCFPYGYKILEKNGEGKCIKLTATVLETV